jgi:hypothetical protein
VIQLTWRQFRTQAFVVFGVLGIIAVVLAVTGPRLADIYGTAAECTRIRRPGLACSFSPVTNAFRYLQQLSTVLTVAPMLIGIFWGAPLVSRELETGTFRLAWTQSVSRGRWLAVKLGVVGLAAMAAAGLLSLMLTWWASPIDNVNMNRFSTGLFGERGIAPIGYAAFAFALGVAAGLLIRRTLPAMAATLVAFVGARLAFQQWVRPLFATPLRFSQKLRAHEGAISICNGSGCPGIPRGAWVVSGGLVNGAGQSVTPSQIGCFGVRVRRGSRPPSAAATKAAFQHCLAQYRDVASYQPPSRYWAFQWYETACFVALALLLGAFCFWWLRRRLV